MQSLVVLTLILILVKYVVDLAGKDLLSSYIYNAFLVVTGNKDFKKLHQMKKELREINREKLLISAQDQYAKWTKLNRRYDKLKKETEATEKMVLAAQAGSLSKIKAGLTFLTVAPYWYYKVMYRKLELFHLPKGLFPRPFEMYLSFPSVTTGTVGIGGWIFLVNSVLGSLEFLVKQFFLTASVEKPVSKGEPKIEELHEQPIMEDVE